MLLRLQHILEHRKRKRLQHHSGLRDQLFTLMLALLLVIVLHSGAMMWLEQMSAEDAIWLTLTSATTVGYGDLSAETTAGRIVTMVLLYMVGIGLLAQVVAMYFEYRQDIRYRMLRGQWSWNMKDHIVFLNCPEEAGEEYYFQAVSQLRASDVHYATRPIVIVSENFVDGLPERLRRMDVCHVSKPLSDNDALRSASALQADVIIILAYAHLDPTSDSITFEMIDRLREQGFKGRIIAEAVRDENRARLKRAGANNVLRPIRSYPELLMRSILAPGSEQVIEKLFDSHSEECIRYIANVQITWLEVIQKLASHDIGLPIAYEDKNGEIFSNPPVHSTVDAAAFFVIVREGNIRPDEEIVRLLAQS